MTTDKIKYEEIKTTDLAIACESSTKATNAQNLVNRHEGSAWTIVSGFLYTNVNSFSALTALEDKKEIMKELKKVIHPSLEKVLGRTDIKWTQDKDTAVICKYIGDFAKIILADKVNEWLPGDNTCAPRCAILKECKSSTDPLKAFKQLMETAGKLELSGDDAERAVTVTVELVNTLALKGKATVEDIDSMLKALEGIVISHDALEAVQRDLA